MFWHIFLCKTPKHWLVFFSTLIISGDNKVNNLIYPTKQKTDMLLKGNIPSTVLSHGLNANSFFIFMDSHLTAEHKTRINKTYSCWWLIIICRRDCNCDSSAFWNFKVWWKNDFG